MRSGLVGKVTRHQSRSNSRTRPRTLDPLVLDHSGNGLRPKLIVGPQTNRDAPCLQVSIAVIRLPSPRHVGNPQRLAAVTQILRQLGQDGRDDLGIKSWQPLVGAVDLAALSDALHHRPNGRSIWPIPTVQVTEI
jgi:hypothetical protein